MVARKIPDWEFALIRKSPRIRFVAPVEVLFAGEFFPARSYNLSAGGMLLEADCHLSPQSQLHIHFQLPTRDPILSAARVVHCSPGKRFGIEFINMAQPMRDALRAATQVETNFDRRSIRVPERLFVRLHWRGGGIGVEHMAQTVLLSRHGCLLRSPAIPAPNSSVSVYCPDKRIAATARIVWRRLDNDGFFTVALEFASGANFWDLDFVTRSQSEPSQLFGTISESGESMAGRDYLC